MNGPAPAEILIVTPLDYLEQRNNVEHNRAAQYARRGHRVTVLYKTMNHSARPLHMLRDALTCRLRRGSEGEVRLLGVDPFCNYFAGLRKDAEQGAGQSGAPGTRLRLIRLLSPLAALRDLFVVPCWLAAVLFALRGRYGVCLGFGPWGGLLGWLLRRLGRVELLVYEDHDYEPGLVPDRLRRAYTAAFERFGTRRADLVVSVGELLAELRREESGVEALVIPNGVDRSKYEAARNAERTGSTLLYVGNVISWSGVEQVIRALPALARTHPDVTLRVIGDGLPSYLQRLRELVAELGVDGRVSFLGPRPPAELPEHLAAADLGLAISEPIAFRRYASPLKLMEYMAAGLPAVVTEGTEAALVVQRAAAGIAVPFEVEALTRELGVLLADPTRRAALATGGVQFSRELDWELLVDREAQRIAELSAGAAASRAGGSR